MTKELEIVEQVRSEIICELEYLEDVSDEKLRGMISERMREVCYVNHIPMRERFRLERYIFDSMRKLDILQNFLEDQTISEIMINGPDDIFIERNGRIIKSDMSFTSEESLRNIIQKIVASCNRVVNEASPIVDCRLEDGSRVNAVLAPIAINGPILTIRRFPKKPFMMEDLIRINSLDKDTADFLHKLVIAGYNIIVSGGTGSGKTTFLNALSAYIPADERIITIEDSAELQIQGIDNLVSMETKNANIESSVPITIRDLIKTSLRMRPNRIIVGEVRGGEAMDMVCSAMNCGHDGSMSTVHSNSALDTISRLETMILTAANLPLHAIRRQIGSGVDIIIHLGRLRDKSRRVLEIAELYNGDDDIIVNSLFKFMETGTSQDGKVLGKLVKTGELINDEKIKSAGLY